MMYKYHVMVPGTLLGNQRDQPDGPGNGAVFAEGKAALLQAGDWETAGTAPRWARSSSSGLWNCPSARRPLERLQRPH